MKHPVHALARRPQAAAFFDEGRVDMDGFLVETTGQCEEGMDIAYDGTWGYHALVLTLANTCEVLSVLSEVDRTVALKVPHVRAGRLMNSCTSSQETHSTGN